MAVAMDVSSSARLLRLIGYTDDEITSALVKQHGVTHAAACSTLQQVDNSQREDTHGSD